VNTIFDCLPESLRLAAGQQGSRTSTGRLPSPPTTPLGHNAPPHTPMAPHTQGSRASKSSGSSHSDVRGGSASTHSSSGAHVTSSSQAAGSVTSGDSPSSSTAAGVVHEAAASADVGGSQHQSFEARTQQQQQQQSQHHQQSRQQPRPWQPSPRASLAASSRLNHSHLNGNSSSNCSSTDAWLRGGVAAGKGGQARQLPMPSTSSNRQHRPLSSQPYHSAYRNSSRVREASKEVQGAGQKDSQQTAAEPAKPFPAWPSAANATPSSATQMSSHARRLSTANGSTRAHPNHKGNASSGSKHSQQAKPRAQAFPELDAMEMEFQQMLSAPSSHSHQPSVCQPPSPTLWDGSKSSPVQQQQQQQQQQVIDLCTTQTPPEPKALTWAERNLWFGIDSDMTALAYQVVASLMRLLFCEHV